MAKKPASIAEEVRDAFVTNHPLIRAGRMAADAGEWVIDKGREVYRRVTTPLPPAKRPRDIYLRPPATRSPRKR